jgi:hypothetical protein
MIIDFAERVRAMRFACKDCDAFTAQPESKGWRWVDLCDGEEGWRCPKCVEGWRVIVERAIGPN